MISTWREHLPWAEQHSAGWGGGGIPLPQTPSKLPEALSIHIPDLEPIATRLDLQGSVSRLVRHQQKGWIVGMQERTASAAEDQFLQPCATIEAHDHKVAAERLDLSLNDLAGI